MASNLKAQTKKGLYWTFFNQFSNYGMQFIIGIVMARLLSPEDFGITALPAVFLALANVFVDSGFANALIRKPNLTEKDLSTAFYYSLIVGVICYLLLFFLSPEVARFYNTPILEKLLRITAITFLFTPLGTPQRVILNRSLDFKTPTKINIVTRMVAGMLGIIFAYIGYGIWALVISNLFSTISGVVLNWTAVRWMPRTRWSGESFRYLWGYGNKLMLSSIIDTAYKNIAPIFIGKFYTPSDLGVYNRALGYANLPSQNVTQTIRSVTFPVLAKMQDNNVVLAVNYRRMLKVLCFVVFPLMLLLAGLAKPLVMVMLTSKWEGCILLLQILCFSQMWYPVAAINLNLLQVKGRSDLFLRLEIIKKIIGIVVLSITLPLGMYVFCYGSIVCSLLDIFINTYYTQQLLGISLRKQIIDILPSLSMSLAAYVLLLFIVNTINDYFCQLAIGVLATLIFYIGGAIIFKFPELKDIRYILNRHS